MCCSLLTYICRSLLTRHTRVCTAHIISMPWIMCINRPQPVKATYMCMSLSLRSIMYALLVLCQIMTI